MILLTNGDSWTQGDSPAQDVNWEATKSLDWYDIIPEFGNLFTHIPKGKEITTIKLYKFYDSQIWPKVLGKRLGVETWNCGKLGVSNDRIFRTTINSIEYLESLGKKDLFVVIGLSSVLRYETWNEYKPNHWECTRLHADDFISKDDRGYKFCDNVIYKTIMNVINLQNFCKNKNIPYLFFSAFDDMDEDLKTSALYKYIDLNRIYNRNFKGHFKEYIEDKFNTTWFKRPHFETRHPTDISHIEWGNHLYDYILKNKII